jgi:hypothetical protein
VKGLLMLGSTEIETPAESSASFAFSFTKTYS